MDKYMYNILISLDCGIAYAFLLDTKNIYIYLIEQSKL